MIYNRQEVEHRLRGSFIDEGEITDRFGDRKNYAFLRLLSLVTEVWWSQRLGPRRRHWTDDPVQYAQVETATKAVLAALRPNGRRRRDGDIDPEAVGWFQAGTILNDLRAAGEGALEASYVEIQILSDIGKMIDRVPADFFRSETIKRAMKDEGE